MPKERLIWLDSLKGSLILIVILGHAIQYCLSKGACENNYWWNLIYSFHMPAFMAAMVLLFSLWLTMSSYWNMHELPFFLKGVPIVPPVLLQYAYRFATAFVAIYLIFSISPLLLNSDNILNLRIVHLGQISLGIYVVHLILIIPMSPWLVSIMSKVSMPIMILSSFVITSIISIVIVELLNKNKYTSRYLLGKI